MMDAVAIVAVERCFSRHLNETIAVAKTVVSRWEKDVGQLEFVLLIVDCFVALDQALTHHICNVLVSVSLSLFSSP